MVDAVLTGSGTRDLLAERAVATPDRLAVLDADGGERWTYAELHATVETVSGRLVAAGIEAGDRVALLVGTSPDAVRAIHALLRIGATPVPLDVTRPPAEIERRTEVVGATHLLCVSDTERTALEVARDRPLRTIALSDADQVTTVETFEQVPVPEPERRPETMFVLFTSGTTGPSQAVRLTARNVQSSAVASAFRLGVRRNDRWFCCLPLYHMGGLAPVLRSVIYGTAAVIQAEFDAERTPRATRKHEATGISLVPTTLSRIFDAGTELADSLRFVLLGGAAASQSLLDACETRGLPVYPTYGSTETASQIATATPEEAFQHDGTVGRPLFGTTVRIVDDDGTEQPAGVAGEIVVDGPTVSPGYLGGDGSAFSPLGLRTGDLGYRDDDGRLYVLGRTDDVIVTGGENVRAGTVEEVLTEHPAVSDVAVVGVDDPQWGERVAALVVAAADAESFRGAEVAVELREFCRDRLAGFQVPKTIRVAEAIPRTASGTVDRDTVRERLSE